VSSLLLIDDNPADATLLREATAEVGCAVTLGTVDHGGEALELLDTTPDLLWPDLALLDLNMPQLGGRDFLGIRAEMPRLRRLPVFVLSTSDHPGDAEECHALGAEAYLVKPMEFGGTVELMRGLCSFIGSGACLDGSFARLPKDYAARQFDAWVRWVRARRAVEASGRRLAQSREALHWIVP
jgi:two-component system, chemotaxis family, response regulator Rcp1